MDHVSVTPFITSIHNVFSTMMQLPVSTRAAYIKRNPHPDFEVSGVIGFSGDTCGTVVISMTIETAERLTSLLSGTMLKAHSTDFADALGELLNMIAGGAKALLTNSNSSMSCPTVVIGTHAVTSPSGAATIVIPCHTDCGELVLEVTLGSSEDAATRPINELAASQA